jgi:hypothetical protein
MAYQYQKLGDGDIRLLLLQSGHSEDPIRISIVHSRLTKIPEDSFEALSYAWGDAKVQEQIHTSSGEVLSVTVNLAKAL